MHVYKVAVTTLVPIALSLLACHCGKDSANKNSGSSASKVRAWAVGTHIGGGSFLTGPSSCTYEAAPEVAELTPHYETGKNFMAKLIGPGTVTETCGDRSTTYDVVIATSLRIDGPSALSMEPGESAENYRVVPVGDGRDLDGIVQGGAQPVWELSPDCAGVAAFGAVLGAQDTGGADITRSLVASGAGTCTIGAEALGLSASKVVTIEGR